jgi:coenzyme F420 hydrogenase subunit beta
VSEAAERAITAACPGSIVAPWQGAPNRHEYWGPWHQVFTGYANDEVVRHQSSSGGAISALLIHALQSGTVDRVLHIAADPSKPTRNIVSISVSEDEVISGAGSRYASSSPLEDINAELAKGGTFAFVGKPCDASALRQLALVDDRVARRVPIILSFFCGGVPSHDGADRIIAAMGLSSQEVVEFRYRGMGWPGNAVAKTADGRSAEMSYADSWGGHLSKEVQLRCKICPDAIGGVADIACADAWYGDENGFPDFNEQAGRSLIVTRSAAGEKLLADALAAGALTVDPLDVSSIDEMQPAQARRKRLVRARMTALRLTLQPRPRMDGLMVDDAARRGGIGERLRNVLGTIRRVIVGRR